MEKNLTKITCRNCSRKYGISDSGICAHCGKQGVTHDDKVCDMDESKHQTNASEERRNNFSYYSQNKFLL